MKEIRTHVFLVNGQRLWSDWESANEYQIREAHTVAACPGFMGSLSMKVRGDRVHFNTAHVTHVIIEERDLGVSV